MKITVKKGEEILISREDAVSVADKGGAYEAIYADETGPVSYTHLTLPTNSRV